MTRVTADEAARRLGVKVETVYAYVSRGVLQSHHQPGSRASWFDAGEIEHLARRGRPRRTTRPSAVDFVLETRIAAIGDHQLRYRGVDVGSLATTKTFEEVADLLWTGQLPEHYEPWEPVALPSFAGLAAADRLRHAVVAASAADSLAGDLRPAAVVARARLLIASMVSALPIAGDARTPRLTLASDDVPLRSTIAGRLWARLAPGRPKPGMLGALNAALVLLADHELAVSTLAARVAASARADPYSVVLSGMGPLAGPLHGRASRVARHLLDAARLDGPEPALGEVLARDGHYPGFGHVIYPDADPRAVVLLDLLRRAAAGTEAMGVADAVLATVRRRAHVEPNVDFVLAALTAAASMAPDAGEVIFTVARTAGWLAHALEEYTEAPLRFRPRAVYVG